MNRSTGVSMGGLNKSQEQTAVRPQLQHLFIDNKYFADPWHDSEFMEPPPLDEFKETWRLKEKMKTSGVALVVCLNIGTDPPDIVKPTPCARRECWFDPTSVPKQKGLEVIGNALQQQYEKWHSKAKYKQSLDPTSSELERTCINLRRQTRSDRLLLHYNGHGVPRPTKNGELWVFGKHYTHYMPVNVYELRNWLGDPSIYVLDCSGAGALLPYFSDATPHHGSSAMIPNPTGAPPTHSSSSDKPSGDTTNSLAHQCIVLAACQAHEMLPIMNPQYPADIFTACLTTPLPIAIRWFILQNPHISSQMSLDISENIPGKDGDRKTPKGELNWIFTAVADTIAWSCLPSALFQKMFRQDLLVASLFRNFLLAKRIMKSLNCTPQSIPPIPDCATHPLWHAWDAAVEHCLLHVHSLQQKQKLLSSGSSSAATSPAKGNGPNSGNPPPKQQQPPTFGAPGIGMKPPAGPPMQGVGAGAGAGAGVLNMPPQAGAVSGPAMFGMPTTLGPTSTQQQPPQQKSQQQFPTGQNFFGAPPPSFQVDSKGGGGLVPGQQPLLHMGSKGVGMGGGVGVPTLSSTKSAPMPMSPRGANGPPPSSSPSAPAVASSPFFSEQMTAFEIWLDFGGAGGSYVESHQPPMCLPILLQALLSHAHRLKALHLLRRYVALGPEAVHSILAVGNYPYILKLLHNPVVEIRYVLMSIWTYVIGFDRSCREELVKDIKDKNKSQFLHCLQSSETPHQQRTMAAFIQAEICHQYKIGQQTCLNLGMHKTYINLLSSPDVGRHPHLKKWLAFCLAKLCEDMPICKKQCILDEVQLYLYPLLLDAHPFVRSASLLALGDLFGASVAVYPQELPENQALTKEQWNIRGKEVEIAMQILESCVDGCASVRREAVVAISKMIMLPIHFECLKHVATAIFEFTGETSFYSNGYLNAGGREGTSSVVRDSTVPPLTQASSVPNTTPLSEPEPPPVSSPGSGGETRSKPLFSLPSPLRPRSSKQTGSESTSSSFFNKKRDNSLSPPPPPASPDRRGRYVRSNSCSADTNQNDAATWSQQADHTLALVKSVQDMIETRMDFSHVRGTSVFNQPTNTNPPQTGPSERSPPPPHLFAAPQHNIPPPVVHKEGMYDSDYSVGISLEDTTMQHVKPIPIAPPSAGNFRELHGKPSQQQSHPPHQQQSRPPNRNVTPPTHAFTPPMAMNSNMSLQMATSYVHLWLTLTDIQNSDPHPIISKSVRAIFMHMKVEVAKEFFRTTADNDEADNGMDHNSGPTASSSPHRGATANNTTPPSRALLHLSDRPGQEYGQASIAQDKWLASSIYAWNRMFFLKPDIGYNPHDDLLSEVGKERSLRMLLRDEVKSLSNRIVENFRPIRDVGMHGLFDDDGRERGDSAGSRVSGREGSGVQKVRSASGQDEDGMQAALLPASLTKFESKGIIRIDDADLSTSSLMFHAFHDILAITDNKGVGIWSLESGNQILHINATSHLSTFGGQKTSDGANGAVGRGPMSPVRYQHHPVRNLPYRNTLRPSHLNGGDVANDPHERLKQGASLGASRSFENMSASTSSNMNSDTSASQVRPVGGYGDPHKATGEGGRGQTVLDSGGEGAQVTQVTSMHWVNESLDTLLMVGTDDGNVRIFRDVGSGIESSMHSDRERGGGGGTGMFSHDGGQGGGGAYRQNSGRYSSQAGSERGSIYSSVDSTHTGGGFADGGTGISTSPGVVLAAAFKALPDISPRGVGGSGLVTSWQQSSGMLSVGGNSSTIRLWDVAREMSVTTFHTGVETCLTCLVSQAAMYSPSESSSSSQHNGTNNNSTGNAESWGETVAESAYARDQLDRMSGGMGGKRLESSFAWSFAGFADGSIGIFDQRVSAFGGKVHSAKEHNSWIVSAHLRADVPEIVTGAYSGVVKFWDIRSMRSYKTIEVHKTPMTSLTVHNCAPIMATGSHAQFIKILTLGGDQLGMIRHHKMTFMGQRIGPVASLSFHPIRLVMAAACTDNLVSIYSIQDG